jgi:hypothetical protein
MVVSRGSMCCLNPGCGFGSGGTLEYAAELEGGWTAGALAVAGMFEKDLAGYSAMDIASGAAAEAETRKRIHDFFRTAGDPVLEGPHDSGSARGWLVGQGFGEKTIDMFFIPAGKTVREKLRTLLASPYCDNQARSWKSSEDVVIVPYYAERHAPSGFFVLGFKNRCGPPRFFSIDASKFCFGGLHKLHPGINSVDTANESMLAGQINNVLMCANPAHVCLPFFYDRNKSDSNNAWLPSRTVYHFDRSLETGAGHLEAMRRSGCEVMVACENPRLPQAGWDDFVTAEAMRCGEHQLDRMFCFLESVDPDPAMRLHIQRELETRLPPSVVGALTRKFADSPLADDPDGTLFGTPEGYVLRRTKNLARVPVTNFTVILKTTISHTDGNDHDTMHEGVLIKNGKSMPFRVDHAKLDNTAGFEREAQRAAAIAEETTLPAVLEKKYMRIVLSHLRNMASKTPVKKGSPGYGWNKNGSEFHIPGMCFSADGDRKAGSLHPKHEELAELYGATPVDPAEWTEGLLHPEVADCVSAAVAQICRHRAGLPLVPLIFNDSAPARVMLSGMFTAFGQTKVPDFSTRTGKGCALRGANGLPVLVSRLRAGARELGYPYWSLSDDGGEFLPAGVEKDKDTVAGVMRMLLPVVVKALAEGIEPGKQKAVSHFAELAREGALFVARLPGMSGWFIRQPNTPVIERILEGINPAKDTGRLVHYMVDQLLEIRGIDTSPADTEQLLLELSHLGARHLNLSGGTLLLDSLTGLSILRNFYEKIPAMKVETRRPSLGGEDEPVLGGQHVLA